MESRAKVPGSRAAAEQLLANMTIENGVRLVVLNVEPEGQMLDELRSAKSLVVRLLARLDAKSTG